MGFRYERALQAGYSPEEIRGYLAKKEEDKGLLSKIASAIITPAKRYAGLVGEAGAQTGRWLTSPALRKSTFGMEMTPEETKEVAEMKPSYFMRPEELETAPSSIPGAAKIPLAPVTALEQFLKGSPLGKAGAKRTAAGMSYAIPYGKGAGVLTKALLPGAVTGALAEYSSPISTPGSVTRGAGYGAGTAGLLYGAGKVLNKLKPAGDELRRGVTNPQVPPGVYGARKEATLSETLDSLNPNTVEPKIRNKFGLKAITGSAKAKYRKLAGWMDFLNDRISKTLKKSKKIFGNDDIQNLIDKSNESIYTNLHDKTFNTARYEALSKLDEGILAGDPDIKISPTDFYKWKNYLGKNLKAAFRKPYKKEAVPLTTKESALMSLWESVDDIITNKITKAKADSSLQSTLHKVAPGLEFARRESLLRPMGAKITSRPAQALQDFLGRGLQTAGKGIEGAGDITAQQITPETIQKLGAMFAGQQQPSQAPSINEPTITQTEGQAPTAIQTGVPYQPSGIATQPTQLGGQAMPSQDLFGQAALVDIASTGGENLNTIKNLQAFLFPEEEKDAATRKRELILKQASPVLGRVITSAIEAPTGVAGSWKAMTGRVPGVAGGEAEYLDRQTKGFARLIADAFASEVGTATDKDIERWLGILPKPGDTFEERVRMSQDLINQIIEESNALGMEVPSAIIQAANKIAVQGY